MLTQENGRLKSKNMYLLHGNYRWNIMLEKCGHPALNVFYLKWIIGTHGNQKKSKSWGSFWSYQLNSTANLAHLAHFLGKWAGLAALFSWYIAPKWLHDFDFFKCHACQTFILHEIHHYLYTLKSWHNNSFLSGVTRKRFDFLKDFTDSKKMYLP